MSKIIELSQIVPAIIPVNLATGANDGDWVSLQNHRRCLVVLLKGIGVAGDDPVFTLQQAKDNAGTGVKALTFTEIYYKRGATALTAVAQWTKVTQAAAGTYTDALSAENEFMAAVEVRADQLDVDEGFSHLRLTIPDVGAGGAQIGGAFYLLMDPRYQSANPTGAIA